MPRLTALDELFVHQVPAPLTEVAEHSEYWRESYFFVCHAPEPDGDVLILAMARYPARHELDALQMGRVDGAHVFARHARPEDGDPHTTTVGPAAVEVREAFRTVRLTVAAGPDVPVALDATFTARTAPYALRRGTMRAGDETVWDQSHLLQAGTFDGTYTVNGETRAIDGWLGQRDHSWGVRNHARCPFWMWLAIQLPDGMFGMWHWEYANGARVYTDGCFAPADGGPPVPVVDFGHDLHWTDADGKPVDYGRDGTDVRGLAGRVVFTLAGGRTVAVDGEGTWAMPYGGLGGGQHRMAVRTDDGRVGSAVYELTGAYHHRYFPVPRADGLPE